MDERTAHFEVGVQGLFELGSLLTGYIKDASRETLIELAQDPDVKWVSEYLDLKAWPAVTEFVASLLSNVERWDLVRSGYIDLFDRKVHPVSCCETEYGQDRSWKKAVELADIAGFYKAFGLEAKAEASCRKEMLDHISVELEFYSCLILKQMSLSGDSAGQEIVQNARKDFLKDHLGRFVSAIADHPAVKADAIFAEIFDWVRQLVDWECRRQAVTPAALTWDSHKGESSSFTCGSSESCSGRCSSPQ
jgi:nitrate reductase assembly molybdenum cofactor insertion protein NarJ